MPPQSSQPPDVIGLPYLLIIHIPVYVDESGHRFTDELWHKDLVRHLEYLTDFTLACPHIYQTPPAGYLSLEGYPIRFCPLPMRGGRLRNFLGTPQTALAFWQAIGKARIVHSAVGDWNPWSMSNLAFAISMIRRRYRLINVESSTWRILPNSDAGISQRIAATLSEWMNRACVSTANLSFFTQAEYKESLLRFSDHRGHVIHASWIDDDSVLTDSAARETWTKKRDQTPIRYIFAGRLDKTKGVDVLLQALRCLDGAPLQVDIMGKGDLEGACKELAEESRGQATQIRLLPMVPYGQQFFSTLQDYSAVLVPSVGDEQPRIVYDAYSQAVPVLASSTPGLRDCVQDGETGHFVPPNDAKALAQAMIWGSGARAELELMGLRGLEKARSLTHGEMHRTRQRILAQDLAAQFPAG